MITSQRYILQIRNTRICFQLLYVGWSSHRLLSRLGYEANLPTRQSSSPLSHVKIAAQRIAGSSVDLSSTELIQTSHHSSWSRTGNQTLRLWSVLMGPRDYCASDQDDNNFEDDFSSPCFRRSLHFSRTEVRPSITPFSFSANSDRFFRQTLGQI